MIPPPWDELPRDLWRSIFRRLPLVDCVRASAVCKQWSLTLGKTPRSHVWALIKGKDFSTIRYFDLSDGKQRNLNLRKPLAPRTCLFQPWVVILRDFPKMHLVHLISGVEVPLPTFSTTQENVSLHKIQVSSEDLSEFVVAGSFDNAKTLALCRPKDEGWTKFEGLDIGDDACYLTLKFHNGILYALVTIKDATPQVQTHVLKLPGDHKVILKIIIFRRKMGDPFVHRQKGDPFENRKPYLVDSKDELLLVFKILKVESDPDIPSARVSGFQVFKVKATDTLGLTKMSNLKGQTLFVDTGDAISLPSENYGRNCIYFLEGGIYKFGGHPKSFRCPSGSAVFYLDDGRIEPLKALPKEESYVSWYLPNIKLGGID